MTTYTATVKLITQVTFDDDGSTDLKSQVAECIMDGDFNEIEIFEIMEPEECSEAKL